MFIRKLSLCFLCVVAFAGLSAGQSVPQPPASQDQIGYKSAANADEKKTLLLKDFHPVPMLHAQAHSIDRAKYYVIDVHSHVNDAMGIDDHMPPERVVEIMNNTNVKTVVILTGMWGDKLQKVIDEMVKPYPGRFIVFARLIGAKSTIPISARRWSRSLTMPWRRGARGSEAIERSGAKRSR